MQNSNSKPSGFKFRMNGETTIEKTKRCCCFMGFVLSHVVVASLSFLTTLMMMNGAPPPPPPPPTNLLVPPPPPPPPAPVVVVDPELIKAAEEERLVQGAALMQACRLLEQARCQEAELEGLLYFASSLLEQQNINSGADHHYYNPDSGDNHDEQLPQVIEDAYQQVAEAAAAHPQEMNKLKSENPTTTSAVRVAAAVSGTAALVAVSGGQWGKTVQATLLGGALKKASETAADIQAKRSNNNNNNSNGGALLQECLTRARKRPMMITSNSSSADTNNDRQILGTSWLNWMTERRNDIVSYHAKFGSNNNSSDTTGISSSIDYAPTGDLDAAAHKRARLVSNGFEIPVKTWLQPIQDETLFTANEVMGKYLDLENKIDILQGLQAVVNYNAATANGNDKDSKKKKNAKNQESATTTATTTTTKPLTYTDVLQILANGLNNNNNDATTTSINKLLLLPEDGKLRYRKVYGRCLMQLQEYLTSFLTRTRPLLDIEKEIIAPAMTRFQEEWIRLGGGIEGWRVKPTEMQLLASSTLTTSAMTAGVENGSSNDEDINKDESSNDTCKIDLSQYETAQDFAKVYEKKGGDALLGECVRLGLKCGGTNTDKAKRLFLTKNKPRSEWPKKIFLRLASSQQQQSQATTTKQAPAVEATADVVVVVSTERRVDLAQREAVVMALIDQVRPTLEATIRRVERRQGQTSNEREKEVEEDLYGSETVAASKKNKSSSNKNDEESSEDDDDEDEDDAPIYNPKNVPLDWDGKPIPYWLFKLHGLNHYYTCEICGGESYRGRRNFELHFADNKHAFGMKSLGIPNTKHFHGVTKIEDAQNLWKSLQEKLNQDQFDGSKEEEYEDTHGNVLSRTEYEDLARQGLL